MASESAATASVIPAIPRPTRYAKQGLEVEGTAGDVGSVPLARTMEDLRALAVEGLEERRLQIAGNKGEGGRESDP